MKRSITFGSDGVGSMRRIVTQGKQFDWARLIFDSTRWRHRWRAFQLGESCGTRFRTSSALQREHVQNQLQRIDEALAALGSSSNGTRTTGFEKYGRKTKRERFLEEMEQVVPWAEIQGLVSGRRRRTRSPSRWPPSASHTARADFPHAAFTKTQDLRLENVEKGEGREQAQWL